MKSVVEMPIIKKKTLLKMDSNHSILRMGRIWMSFIGKKKLIYHLDFIKKKKKSFQAAIQIDNFVWITQNESEPVY